LANLYAGRQADRIGRKPLLIVGWIIGLPVPLIIMFAPSWEWIVFANILLGVNQGLCWSTALIMKVDLVGPVRRGLATGLNEFSGYLAMAASTVLSGWIAAQTALRPYPFYLGMGYAILGLLLSVLLVRETREFSRQEARQVGTEIATSFSNIFKRVSWQDKSFFSLSQGGLVNNLNDVVIWGLLPILAIRAGLSVERAAALGGTYLAVWGSSQLITGPLSDRIGRKPLIAVGLWLQAVGIALIALIPQIQFWFIPIVLMGLGTGMVYPGLLAAISDLAHPSWRASALGVYRLWRDSGYAAGALLAGVLSDLVSIEFAVLTIAAVTGLSGLIVAVLLPLSLKHDTPLPNAVLN
jgi:MFS family permease